MNSKRSNYPKNQNKKMTNNKNKNNNKMRSIKRVNLMYRWMTLKQRRRSDEMCMITSTSKE